LQETTGHQLTRLFHVVTLHELYRSYTEKEIGIEKIVPEQTVLLELGNGKSIRRGRFDFLVLTGNGKSIGFEVLSRPSEGKMKRKLAYAKEVDEFVFVLPTTVFELYRKNPKHGFRLQGRKLFFSKEFSLPTLYVWLINPENGKIEQKAKFSQLFNTREQ
jgi:hypothetical protein